MSVEDKDCLIIWDLDNQWVSGCEDILLWKKYEVLEFDKVYSILQLVEENSEQLKLQYLALIYELGESKFNGKRVIESLEVRPGFSYWWMTLLTEKCNLAKSPQIDSAIKLMAFKKWLENKDYNHIKLVSTNVQLAEAVSLIASKLQIDFEWKKARREQSRKSFVRRTSDRLPYYVQGLVWLIQHLITHWALKGVGVKEWKKTKGKTTFISYLFNLNSDSVKTGHFKSRHWTALPQLLEECKIESNWLHIYVKDAVLKNSKEAKNLINQFNQSHVKSQVHVTLHSFLSFKVILSAIWDWFKMVRLSKSLGVSLQKNSGSYWPFLKKDYFSSMAGSTLMCNMLYLNLFQSAMMSLPHQKRGVYLKENQGWEFGFIHSWRAAKHSNNLIGAPHTPSKFWDLRLYFDKRSYERPDTIYNLPLPDYVGM